MNSRDESRLKQKQCHDRARDISSHAPWKCEAPLPGVELRWIPETPDAGEYLLRYDENGGGRSPDVHSQVWLGVKDSLMSIAREVTVSWFGANSALLNRCTGGAEVLIIIGPCLRFITGEWTEEAFVMPHFNDQTRRFQFLICVGLPQPLRTSAQEKRWLRSSLTHELEHVYQFICLNDTLLERSWRPMAEKCAVFAEVKRYSKQAAVLEYGADFLRCAPLGMTGRGGDRSLSPLPYWTFPFMEHLASVCPNIHREIWEQPGMRALPDQSDSRNPVLERGPWLVLDALLQTKNRTLRNEWIEFCKTLIKPVPDTSASLMTKRFGSRLPTLRLDLNTVQAGSVSNWEWRTWPLSVHWIHVANPHGAEFNFSWVSCDFAGADIVVLAQPDDGEWRQVEINPLRLGTAKVWNILLIDATVLDMTDLMRFGITIPNLVVQIARDNVGAAKS